MARLLPLVLAVVAVLGASGCAPASSSTAAPSIPELPTPPAESPGVQLTPMPNGMYRSESRSMPIEPGQRYRYRLYTHCGFSRSHVDIDGSFWEPVEPDGGSNPPPGFGNPFDVGTIVVDPADRSRLTFTSPSGIDVAFRRAGTTRDYIPCA